MEQESIQGLEGLKGIRVLQSDQNEPRLTPKQIAGYLKQGTLNKPLKEYVGTPEIGQSVFDKGITRESQLSDLEDTRGELQPWYSQLAAGTAKMGVLATTTFLNSTLGLAAGIGTAVNEGRWSGLWDNKVNKYLNEVNEASEKALPNYYTNEEREEPWYENIFTANFLGDKVLKNMGFTMGAIAAGALTGNFGSSLLAKVGTAGGWVAKGGNIASKVMATTISAAGEASIEALNASDDFMKMNSQYIDKAILEEKGGLDSKYADYMSQLEAKYARGGNTLIPTGENGGFVTKKELELRALESQYKKELQVIQDRREELLAEANEDKLKVGNTTFALNQALLSLTNSLQFGRELAGGFKNAQRAKSLITKSAATGEELSGAKAVGKALLEKDLVFEANKGYGRALAGNITKNIVSEGAEEGAQNVASNASQMKYSAALNTFAGAKINPLVQDEVNDLLSATGQAISEQFGSIASSGWEEVGLGMLSGAVGVPFFKRGKGGLRPTWAGGINEAIKETKEDFKANEIVGKINETIQKPEFVNKYQGMIRHQVYQQKMDEALKDGSEFKYSDSEASQLISDVLMFNKAGSLDGFKEFTKSFKQDSELTDEQVADLKANTLGPNGKSIYEGLNKEQIRETINQNADRTDKMIDNVMKFNNYHLVEYGDIFENDELDELTWLAAKHEDWNNIAELKYTDLLNTLRPVLEELDREEIKDAEGNIIKVSGLLDRSPEQFVAEMAQPDAVLKTALFKALDTKRGEFNDILKEREELDKQIKAAPRKGKGSRKHIQELAKQLEITVDKLNKVETSNTLLPVNALREQLNNVVAPIVAAYTFREKYKEAIKNPASLKESIIKDTLKATEEQVKVQTEKNLALLKPAKSLSELKKQSANLSILERTEALTTLSKEKTPVGKLAKNLVNLDLMHRSLGGLLESSEFTEVPAEELLATRNSIDEAYKNAENLEDMTAALEVLATANPTLASLMSIKKETDKENTTYKDEVETPTTPPIKPPVIKEEMKLEEDEVPTKTTEATPDEVEANKRAESKKKMDAIDASFLDETSFIKLYAHNLDDTQIKDVLDNPTEYTELMQTLYKALYSGTMSDEEFLTSYRGYSKGQKAPVYAEGVRSLKAFFEGIKEKVAMEEANESDKDNPKTFEELGKALEEMAVVIENSNINPNKSGEIRSDGLTEADTEALFPKGQGLNNRGNRFFKSFKDFGGDNYDAYWDYLQASGAFDFVNKGKLADLRDKNPNTKIHFIVDKTLNGYTREGRTPLSKVILMAVEASTPTSIDINGTKYQIVGSLKANTSSIEKVRDRILEQSKQSSEDKFLSPDYSEIDFIYPGRIATSKYNIKPDRDAEGNVINDNFSEKERDVTNKNGSIFFGVFRKDGIFAPNVPEGKAIEPTTEDNKLGRVYMMLKAADGKYYPTPVRRKEFTEEDYPLATYENTPIYQEILEALTVLADPNATEEQRFAARDKFETYIYFGNKVGSERKGKNAYRIRWQKDKLTQKQWLQISQDTGEKDSEDKKKYETVKNKGKLYTVPLTTNIEANKKALLELVLFMKPMFQINSKLLENSSYVDMLVESGVFTTNLVDYTLHNAMFTIKPMDKNGKPIQSEEVTEKPVASTKNPIGTADTYTVVLDGQGREYKLYPNGDVLKADNTPASALAKAYVYAKNAIATGTATNMRKYGDNILYILNMGTGEYAALVSSDGKIGDIYSGDRFDLAIKDQKKYVADERLAKAIAEALANKEVGTSIEDLSRNGYDPEKYAITLEEGDAGYLVFFYSKVTGERVTKFALIPSILNELSNVAAPYSEEERDDMEKMGPIFAPTLNKMLRDFYGEVEEELEKESIPDEQQIFDSIKTYDSPISGEASGLIAAKDMPTVEWGDGVTKALALETMKKAIKAKYAKEPKAPEPKVVTPKLIEPKEKTVAKSSNLIVKALGNDLGNENKLAKDLQDSKELLIFVNLSVEELSKLRAALKSKGVSARTQSQIAEATMTLLGMNEVELQALDTDAIIGKINCK